MPKFIFPALLWCWALCCKGQAPVNAFAGITSISGGSVLAVTAVDETSHSFEDGEQVIVMQMQDSVITTFTTNASSFGDIGNIRSAGLFEVAVIQSHSESAGVPTNITLTAPLANTYNFGPNSAVQLITFRNLGANFTTTAAIGTASWNGSTGGVLAISVASVLTVAHSITADYKGFRGGVKNTPNGYSACDNTTYINVLAQRYAGKGEGIYKSVNSSFAAARGKIANGGGGGNDVNSGGGGGGNYLAGGGGGSGWTSSGAGCSPVAGGLGGAALNTYVSGSRIFMGGGGGGGHENDGNGKAGAPGGGIVIVKAGTLTTVSCAGISISATGSTAANATNDGAGGGGAGGTVVFNVNSFSVSASCPVAVAANGGGGGNSNMSSSGAHGGGGGGAQGAVLYSGPQPTANITTSTVPGNGGVSCSGCPAAVNGVSGTGPANSGIVNSASGPLPVQLLSFDVQATDKGQVLVLWTTAVEKDASLFVLQRQGSNEAITDLAHIKAKRSYSSYSFTDPSPLNGVNYYRLKLINNSGVEEAWPWQSLQLDPRADSPVIFPNPLRYDATISVDYSSAKQLTVTILDMCGTTLLQQKVENDGTGVFRLQDQRLTAGAYIIKISTGTVAWYNKLVVTE